MRVVTFNIRHAESGLARVRDVLRELAPDVVMLQEVDVGCARSGGVDQARALGEGLGLAHAFAAAMDWDGGRYGVALLARDGLEPLVTHALPHDGERRLDGTGEPRVVTFSRWRGLTLGCTHLGLGVIERRAQAEAVRALLPAGRLVLGGDLNEPPDGDVVHAWNGRLCDAFREAGGIEQSSGPDDRPRGRIDAVLRSPSAPRPRAAFVGPAGASDHRPVVVDFEEP